MSKYKAIYSELHSIVKKQHRLSIQAQQQLLKQLHAIASEAFRAAPEAITADDTVIAAAPHKDFSAAAKSEEVADAKENDRKRGFRWIGGNPVKVKNDSTVIDTSDGTGVDQTIKAQIEQQ